MQPPPPILPKTNNRKLKLMDIDAVELARQLCIMESQLYQKIRPQECLTRSREQKTVDDNITAVIKTANRVRSRIYTYVYRGAAHTDINRWPTGSRIVYSAERIHVSVQPSSSISSMSQT